MTRIIPTDKKGNVYYGPKTFAAAKDLLDTTEATVDEVVKWLKEAGYTGVATRIEKYYAI